jgi:hypothetical protein
MKYIGFLGLGLALAACESTDNSGLSRVDVGVSQITATVEFDEATGIYTVTPSNGLPAEYDRVIGDRSSSFNFASPVSGGTGFLQQRVVDGSSAILIVTDSLNADSASVLLSRPSPSNLPDRTEAEYSGEYKALVFDAGVLSGFIDGQTLLTADFEAQTISGSITDRQIFDPDLMQLIDGIPDVTLEAGLFTSDGQIVASGAGPAPLASTVTFILDENDPSEQTYTQTSGTYRGLISGEEGEFLLGGVEIFYEIEDALGANTNGREVGAIFAPIVPLPVPAP